jgi:thiol-disulfide isomerase/thioredoxin
MAGTLLGACLLVFPLTGWTQPLPKEYQNLRTKPHLTLIEFSAPWCLSCKKLKPTLTELEERLGTQLQVVRINVEKPENAKYINRYRIDSAPTFILFNAQGELLQRVETDLEPEDLRQLIEARFD